MKSVSFTSRMPTLPPAVYTAGKYLALGLCALAIAKLVYEIARRLFASAPTVQHMDKMLKNLRKAFEDHKVMFSPPQFDQSPPRLSFELSSASGKGRGRSESQDMIFHINDSHDRHLLAGVCDGHGAEGQKAASVAAADFVGALSFLPDMDWSDMYTTFQRMFNTVEERMKVSQSGTTACVCVVDKKTNYLYVATLGTPEAKVLRKKEDSVEFIPLSPIRNWCHPKEIARVQKVDPALVAEWDGKDPHVRHFPKEGLAVNVSRALGDAHIRMVGDVRVILNKPKISVFQLQPDDVLVVATKGLWGHLEQADVAPRLIGQWGSSTNIMNKLLEFVVDFQQEYPEDIALVVVNAQRQAEAV